MSKVKEKILKAAGKKKKKHNKKTKLVRFKGTSVSVSADFSAETAG